jgi:gas vesicle protein
MSLKGKFDDGIAIKNQTYKEFGKFMINFMLLDDNILLIKYKKSYAPVPSLRRTIISDELKDMIIYLFDTGEIDYQSGQKLSKSEKDIFDLLIIKSGLKTQLKYNKEKMKDTAEDIIEQFNILKGQIIAGNDNPEIKNKIKDLLSKMVNMNKINVETADDIINDLETTDDIINDL